MTQKAVRFIRVSSKEQQDEGYSMEAQDRASSDYARRYDLEIVRTWSVAESAKSADVRKVFKQFVQFMRSASTVKVMLFEKPDRMTRNFKDLVTIYELIEQHDKELHFFKTGLKINRNSKSSDQIQLDIQVVLARNFICNLREEVMKGMRTKVLNGGFPAKAPVGYLNVPGAIVPDPAQAPIVRRLFELYATGQHTVRSLSEVATEMGLRFSNNPKPLTTGRLYDVLRNPLYYGLVSWKDEEVMGKHEPIVTKELFDRVQQVIGTERRAIKTNFPFQGLAICGVCGSPVTSERHVKRQKNGKRHEYMYYRCTGWNEKRAVCKGAYIREEELVRQLGEPLKDLHIGATHLADIRAALKRSYAAEQDFSRERAATLQAEETRLKNRLDAAYNDKLDGVISADEYKEKAAAWRDRLVKVRDEVRALNTTHDRYLEEASRILDVAGRAYAVFTEHKDNFERRKLIDAIVSKVAIKDKRVVLNLREPFQTLSKLASAARSGNGIQGWYARQELNL